MKMAKAFGIAMAAMLAASVIAAGAASALEYKATAGTSVTFKGVQAATQSNKWVVQKKTVSCLTAEYESPSTTVPAKSIKLTPTYAFCTNFGYSEAQSKIQLNGCTFELKEPNMSLVSNARIDCPSGASILLYAGSFFGTCEVLIPEPGNTSVAKVPQQNINGTPSKIETKFELTGIAAEVRRSTGTCPLTEGVINDVTYTAQVNFEDKAGKVGVLIG
jgi:hypothetical protein